MLTAHQSLALRETAPFQNHVCSLPFGLSLQAFPVMEKVVAFNARKPQQFLFPSRIARRQRSLTNIACKAVPSIRWNFVLCVSCWSTKVQFDSAQPRLARHGTQRRQGVGFISLAATHSLRLISENLMMWFHRRILGSQLLWRA